MQFHGCYCQLYFSKVDSVDLRSGCTFCAVWFWSTVATKATIYVKGALKVYLFLIIVSLYLQLGHEPLPPVQCRTFFGFGKEALCYPNVLKYSEYES